MKSILLLYLSFCLFFLSGCTHKNQDVTNAKASVGQTTNTESSAQPTGMGFNKDGTTFLYKSGLDIYNTEPTIGAADVAWKFFKLRGQQHYDEALKYLQGYGSDDLTSLHAKYTNEGRIYLEEVIESKLLRWTDITKIAPKEHEDENVYDYKVIYLEMEFKTRGKLGGSHPTDMKDGINIYAVHVMQAKEHDPWVISMLGGAPPLEK